MTASERRIHVLVIDDSAVVRQAFKQVLSGESDISVSVAADPRIADRKLSEQRPDVVILDLELPVMDGLTWLRRQMQRDPLPVIVCSAQIGDAAIPSIRSLEEGALEVIPKPVVGVRDFLIESRRTLLRSIRAAHMAVLRAPRDVERVFPPAPVASPPLDAKCTDARPRALQVVALAASTGGPQALQTLLTAMPEDCPPILVVQHMSRAFTGAFARRMNELASIEVREACAGEPLESGTALIAPGGRHLEVARDSGGSALRTRLHDGTMQHGHRPSADLLFQSVARSCGSDAVGVLLTGMGCDGASGLLEMRRCGAETFAESSSSCVVFGMPRAAIELGAAVHVAPIDALAALVRGCFVVPRSGSAIENE